MNKMFFESRIPDVFKSEQLMFSNLFDHFELFSVDERKKPINIGQDLAFTAKIAVQWVDIFNVVSLGLMDSERVWKIITFEVLVMCRPAWSMTLRPLTVKH